MFGGMLCRCLTNHLAVFNYVRQISAVAAAAKVSAVYKESKYTKEQTEKVLQTVNRIGDLSDLLRYDISKGRAEKIKTWKSKNGAFGSVEQLLELDGFGLKILDKFMASILSDNNGPQEAVLRPPAPPRTQQFTTPPFNEQLRDTMRTCTAIHVGISSVTWTQLRLEPQTRTSITSWCSHPISDKKIHLHQLVDLMWPIIDEIPGSDVYLLEMPRIAMVSPQGTPAQTNINVQLSQTIAMVSLALANRCRPTVVPPNNENITAVPIVQPEQAIDTVPTQTVAQSRPTNQLLFMRQYLASRLFQTIVGTERISSASIVSDLLQNRLELFKPERQAFIGAQLKVSTEFKAIYESAERREKEYMGQSLLMALSFVRLGVVQCPQSLAMLGRRGK